MTQTDHDARLLVRRTLWCGLAVSLLIHAGLLAVMLFASVRSWLDQLPSVVIQAPATTTSGPAAAAELTTTVVINSEDPAPTDVAKRLEESLAASEQLTEAERLEALDRATTRLDRISSEDSVDDVALRLQSWLGLTPRAQRPVEVDVAEIQRDDPERAAAAERAFDFETAQLHDVTRSDGADGRPRYACVLLDAHGCTLEVPLNEAEGEPIYALMQKIKSSPLLEKIYRQLAMPILDQVVRAERAATAAASAAAASEEPVADSVTLDLDPVNSAPVVPDKVPAVIE